MRDHPVLRRRTFLHGQRVRPTGEKDVTWLSPSGREMTEAEWSAGQVKCLGAILAGGDIGEVDDQGRPVVGQTILYLLNADDQDVAFPLPAADHARSWLCLLETADARHAAARTGGSARGARAVNFARPVSPTVVGQYPTLPHSAHDWCGPTTERSAPPRCHRARAAQRR
jgi:glycogen operon protein